VHACVIHGAGDLRVDDLAEREPTAGEITVAVSYGGICGSDLHYWKDGRVGNYPLRAPMVLGHEVVGHVAALGAGVTGPEPGTPVAVHPATTCGRCPHCQRGRRNLCSEVRYLGSAARTPHVGGGFVQRLTVPAEQIIPIPDGLAPTLAVLAEPLAVAVHAVHRAGDLLGQRILVTGAGPIGCLVAAAARAAGAAEVLVTDLMPEPLALASQVGATDTLLATAQPPEVDVAVEASGSPAALATAAAAVRRGGRLVLLGLLPPGEVPFPGNLAVTGELDIRGAFRFHAEFGEALSLLARGLPVAPLVTHTLGLTDAPAAFALAADRRRSGKVLLDLAG
jgi:L-idonate 5-dehydrogenase